MARMLGFANPHPFKASNQETHAADRGLIIRVVILIFILSLHPAMAFARQPKFPPAGQAAEATPRFHIDGEATKTKRTSLRQPVITQEKVKLNGPNISPDFLFIGGWWRGTDYQLV